MHQHVVCKRVLRNFNELVPALWLLFVVLAVAGCGAAKKPEAANLVVTSPPPTITVQHLSQAVAGGAFIVEPGKYKTFKITVGQGMSKPQLEGNFTATGGNNDIEVLLMEETQFLNWQNSHKSDSLYSSGRVTAQKIKVSLPEDPAAYYLIFSNKFSYFRNKGVTADVKLQYDSSSSQ